jgi:MalT-like TPR region
MRLGRQGGIEGIVVDAQITLALVRQAQGRSTEAVALLQQATELVDEWNDAATSIRVRAFGARLALGRDDVGTAEKWPGCMETA